MRQLWKRIPLGLAGLGVLDVASRIVIPGLNPDGLRKIVSAGGLLGIYDRLGGGGLARGSLIALGIMPYLSARLFMWLARLGKRVDTTVERRRVRRDTRWLTGSLSLIQSYGLATFAERIPGAVAQPGSGFVLQTMAVLTMTSLAAMMVVEQFTPSDEDVDDDDEIELLTSGVAQPIDAPVAVKTPARSP